MGPGSTNEFQSRAITLEGIAVQLESYRVGARWGAKVATTDAGNSLARGSGGTREAAEHAALDSAKMVLEMRSAASAFRASTNRMRS